MAKPRMAITSQIIHLYDVERYSLHEVAAALRVNRSVVRERLVERGVHLRNREEADELARQVRPAFEGHKSCQYGPCTADATGYGDDPTLCVYHAKRVQGLLSGDPNSERRKP